MSEEWKSRILTSDEDLRRVCRESKRIAVLGIKTEQHSGQPAFYVPQYMQENGAEVIPVPVYYPEVTRILGQQVFRKVAEVPGEVDMVNVFRRPQDIPPHVEDLIAKKPRFVWFQLGIRNDEAAERLARAGIEVVQDRCLLVEHRRLLR